MGFHNKFIPSRYIYTESSLYVVRRFAGEEVEHISPKGPYDRMRNSFLQVRN